MLVIVCGASPSSFLSEVQRACRQKGRAPKKSSRDLSATSELSFEKYIRTLRQRSPCTPPEALYSASELNYLLCILQSLRLDTFPSTLIVDCKLQDARRNSCTAPTYIVAAHYSRRRICNPRKIPDKLANSPAPSSRCVDHSQRH